MYTEHSAPGDKQYKDEQDLGLALKEIMQPCPRIRKDEKVERTARLETRAWIVSDSCPLVSKGDGCEV